MAITGASCNAGGSRSLRCAVSHVARPVSYTHLDVYKRQVLDLAKQAHAMFAQHGAIGTDIVLSDRGPIINELNANPLHGVFQRASFTGLLSPAFRPLFLAALAEKGITKRQRCLLYTSRCV